MVLKYSLERVLAIISKKAKINGELRYEIFTEENNYSLKIYDLVAMGHTVIKIPICTFSLDKDTYKIESSAHGHILVTRWNKKIVATIGNLTCATIEDFYKYLPREEGSNEKGTRESIRDSKEGNTDCTRDKFCDDIGNDTDRGSIGEGTKEEEKS